jgi:hypothetical protein
MRDYIVTVVNFGSCKPRASMAKLTPALDMLVYPVRMQRSWSLGA